MGISLKVRRYASFALGWHNKAVTIALIAVFTFVLLSSSTFSFSFPHIYPSIAIEGNSMGNTINASATTPDDHLSILPAARDKLVFSSNLSGAWEVYTMNPDGTDVKKVSNNPGANNTLLFLSPDRNRIFFLSESGGEQKRFSVDVDGKNQSDVSASIVDPSKYHGLQWSPDRTMIAYEQSSNDTGNNLTQKESNILVANADGSNATQITNSGFNINPSWLQQGKSIAFSSLNNATLEYSIYVMDLADIGTNKEPVLAQSHAINSDWSPDGSQVVYTNELGYVEVRNTKDGTLASGLERYGATDWSPDSTKLAFYNRNPNRGTWFSVIEPAANSGPSGAITISDTDYTLITGAWSPDSKRLAILYSTQTSSSIYTVDANAISSVQSLKLAKSDNSPVQYDGILWAQEENPNPSLNYSATTVPVGHNPVDIAFNSKSGNAYVLNYGEKTVSIIDGALDKPIGTPISVDDGSFTTFDFVTDITGNTINGNVYVTTGHRTGFLGPGLGNIMAINGTTNTLIGAGPILAGSAARDSIFDSATKNLYILGDGGEVTVFNGTSNKVVPSDIFVGFSPVNIMLNPVNGRLYGVSTNVPTVVPPNLPNGTVTVIDAVKRTTLGTVEVGINPGRIFANPVSGNLYLIEGRGERLTIIDPNSNTIARSILLPQSIADVAFNPTNGNVYLSNTNGTVTVLDKSTDKVLSSIPAGGKALVFNEVDHALYVLNSSGDTVSVINGTTNAVIDSTVHVGAGANAIFANPVNGKVYVINGNNTVSVISRQPIDHDQFHLPVLSVGVRDLEGNEVSGVWTVIRMADPENPSIVKSGFTPLTFIGNPGQMYNVSVANYDGKSFRNWAGTSSINNTRTLTLSENTSLTAIYDVGDSVRGFTPLTYTGTTEQPDLTINAVSLENNETLHMWTIIDPQATDKASGITTYKLYA